jgi:hypothetical protein
MLSSLEKSVATDASPREAVRREGCPRRPSPLAFLEKKLPEKHEKPPAELDRFRERLERLSGSSRTAAF